MGGEFIKRARPKPLQWLVENQNWSQIAAIQHLLLIIFHVGRSLKQLLKPDGTKALVAENFILKHQLLIARLELKRRNPQMGCRKIAQQLARSSGIELNKDVVRRVLATHYQWEGRDDGPSWLALLAHTKDSLWSMDLFRADSLLLKSHWVLIVMDVFTRRIIGFGVQSVAVDGPALCRMFNGTVVNHAPPKRLSYDHDPLFKFQRWQANLRILEIESLRSVPQVPVSHPFVERLIGDRSSRVLGSNIFLGRGRLGLQA